MEEGSRLLMNGANRLGSKLPYFAPVLDRLRFQNSPEVETLGISHTLVVHYNAKYVESLNSDQIEGVLLHEALHFLSDHHRREKENLLKNEANHTVHNIAMDMEINGRLRDYGYRLPEHGVYPDNFELPDGTVLNYPVGLTYENYYKRLLKDLRNYAKKNKDKCVKDPTNGNNSGVSIQMDLDGVNDPSKEGSESGNNNSNKKERGMVSLSGIVGMDSVIEGHDNDTDNLADSLRDLCEQSAKEAGKGSDADLVTTKPQMKKYPWNVLFRNIVSKALGPVIHGYEFRSYCAYNKKNACAEIMIPTWRSRKNEINLCIIMDISGSMYDILEDMYAKIKSMVTMISDDIKVTILETNTDVVREVKDFDLSAPTVKINYGGGTDMTAGWKYIEENKLKPDLIICMSDGYTDWPSKEDSYFMGNKSICILQDRLDDCPYKHYSTEFGIRNE